MTRLFVAAVILASAHAASLGSEKCTWGPAYWCSSLPAARRCSALSHCMDRVWRGQLIDPELTPECKISQKMIKTIRQVLSERKDEDDRAASMMGRMCTFIADDSKRTQCKELVTNFLPEIIQLINSEIEPAVVSHVLGLCEPYDDRSNETPKLQPVESSPSSFECSDCYSAMSKLQTIIKKPKAEEHMATVMERIICSEVGDMKDLCKSMLGSILDKVFKILEESDNPKALCSLSSYCNGETTDKYDLENIVKDIMEMFDGVINEKEISEENAMPCSECNKMTTSVMAFEKESSFRNAVEKAIYTVCSATNIGDDKCQLLSESLIPKELFDMLSKEMDTKEFCSETLYCFGGMPEESTVSHNEVLFEPEQPTPCYACQVFFNDFRRSLGSKLSVSDAKFAVKEACQLAGPLQTTCMNMLNAAIPSVINWLANAESTSVICTSLAGCPKSNSSPKLDFFKDFMKSYEPAGSLECDTCQDVVKMAQDAARNPEVQKAIEDALNTICDEVEPKQDCENLVKEYAPTLFEILVSEMDPTLVCEVMFQCVKQTEVRKMDEEVPEVVVPETVVLKADPNPNRTVKKSKKNSAIYKQRLQETKQEKVGANPECALCRLAMESIDKVIALNSTEEELEKALEKLCGILPSSVKDTCDAFVATNTPNLIELLLQQLDPKLICNELQVCNDTVKVFEVPAAEITKEAEEGGLKDEKCDICQLVVSSVEGLLGENKTEQEIQSALDEICNILPSGIKVQCLSFVNEYAAMVVQLLIQELKPKEVCVTLGLCPSKAGVYISKPVVWKQSAGPLCSLCELVVGRLDQMLESNKSEAAIEKALDEVCSLLPSEVSAQCTSLVNQYAPLIIKFILEEVQPKAICSLLGLCATSPRMEIAVPVVDRLAPETADIECEICKIIITEINNMIGDNRTDEAIIDAVEKVCDLVSGDIRLECKSEVENYGRAVLDLLRHMDDPNEVCQAVKACKAKAIGNASTKENWGKSEAPSGADACLFCQTLATYAGEALNQPATKDEVENLLKDVCTKLPSDIKNMCDMIVDKFTPEILQKLAAEDNPLHICQDIHLCPKEEMKAKETLVGQNECTYGPSFWCANKDNARKCGVEQECIEKYGMEP